MPAEFLSVIEETLPELDRGLDRDADLRYLFKEEIARALDIICRDSGLYPDRYLQETRVPHGGE